MGVFALRAFDPGEFIFRRSLGPPIDNEDLGSLSEEDRRHLCELDFETSALIKPPGCYFNHSCDPNAMRSGQRVFAWKRISKCHEITLDYRLNAFGDDEWECLCRSDGCTGRIRGSYFGLSEEKQLEYLQYAPKFIHDEYMRRLYGLYDPRAGQP